ncbi:MAG: hypothetical protein OJF60_000257 [Burkholderiaceae bacterium]|nr:MAG: hypothetical protein OJF60_000257 [Burkholderiaceae bacterium]
MAHTELPLQAGFEYAVMVLRGAATAGGEAIAPGEWLYFAPGRTTLAVACDAAAQLLLLGGVPFGEDVLVWWNFVARTKAEMQAALHDWNAGRFAAVRSGSPAAPLEAPSLAGLVLKPRR